MKNVLITLVCLLVLLVTLNNLQAQDKKEQHKVHMKIKKIIDGKETVIDSVFTIDGDVDLDEIMKSLGHDKNMGKLHEHKKGDKNVKIETRVEQKIIKKGVDEKHEINVEIETGDGVGEGNVFIFKSDDDDDDENVFIMKKKDGKVITIDADGRVEDLIIIKDGKKVKIKEMIEEGDEKSGKKVIRIKTDKEGEGKMIWHSDDGKVIELDGDHAKEKKMVFIKKSGDGEAVDMDDEEIQKLLKEKGIDWENMDKDKMVIKKTSSININISALEEEDKSALEKMGLEDGDLKNDLHLEEMFLMAENEGPVILKVETKENAKLHATLRDSSGEIISKTVLKESSSAYKIYLTIEESGTYYVTLSQNGKSLTQKLVIKK